MLVLGSVAGTVQLTLTLCIALFQVHNKSGINSGLWTGTQVPRVKAMWGPIGLCVSIFVNDCSGA